MHNICLSHHLSIHVTYHVFARTISRMDDTNTDVLVTLIESYQAQPNYTHTKDQKLNLSSNASIPTHTVTNGIFFSIPSPNTLNL